MVEPLIQSYKEDSLVMIYVGHLQYLTSLWTMEHAGL